MRQCEYKKLLSTYLDNQLSSLQERQVDEHLPRCNSCKEELEELNMIKDLCTKLPEEDLPHGLRQRVVSQAKALKEPSRKYVWVQRVAVPLAAALFIFIAGKYGLGSFSGLSKMSLPEQGEKRQEPAVIAAHEVDDGRAFTADEAPKDELAAKEIIGNQENVVLPNDSVAKSGSLGRELENGNSGPGESKDMKAPGGLLGELVTIKEIEADKEVPFYKDRRYSIVLAGAVFILLLLFSIVKRKR